MNAKDIFQVDIHSTKDNMSQDAGGQFNQCYLVEIAVTDQHSTIHITNDSELASDDRNIL